MLGKFEYRNNIKDVMRMDDEAECNKVLKEAWEICPEKERYCNFYANLPDKMIPYIEEKALLYRFFDYIYKKFINYFIPILSAIHAYCTKPNCIAMKDVGQIFEMFKDSFYFYKFSERSWDVNLLWRVSTIINFQIVFEVFTKYFNCINREHFFTLHAEITRFCQENTFESHFKNVRRYIEHISGNRQPAIQGDWRRRAYPVQPKPIIKDYQCSRTNDKKEKENTLKVLAAEVDVCCQCTDCDIIDGYMGNGYFISPCPCIYSNSGCSSKCGCSEACKNRSGSLKPLADDQDYRIRNVWGLDCYTRKCIELILSYENLNAEEIKAIEYFIQKILLPTINNQDSDIAYNITFSIFEILERYGMYFGFCKRLLCYVCAFGSAALRIHPKGQGVIAKRVIQPHTYILPYIGEVFSPSKWFEKEDGVKQYYYKNKLNSNLQEFYDIVLERSEKDSGGYNLVFVDPYIYGNNGRKLSHSCQPNCVTLPYVLNNRYQISIYSVTEIRPGEELTFDYNCITDIYSEYIQSVCLCSSPLCRGSYLYYSNGRFFNYVFSKFHNLLHRCSYLLRSSFEGISEGDRKLLNKFNFKSNLLNGMSPWLIKSVTYLLKYIDFESQHLPNELLNLKLKNRYDFQSAEIEAKGVKSNRIQNLVIALDKLKYSERVQGKSSCPLRLLRKSEVINYLWNSKNSLANRLISFLRNTIVGYSPAVDEKYKCKTIKETKISLMKVRNQLTTFNTFRTHLLILYDILTLYIYTDFYFTLSLINPGKESKVEIKTCDLPLNDEEYTIESLLKNKFSYFKNYSNSIDWGTYVAWYKHSILNPSASLSADRRGCISLPDIESGFYIDREVSLKVRETYITHLLVNPSCQWPGKLPFQFRNRFKVYGSPMLDCVMYNNDSPILSVFNDFKDQPYGIENMKEEIITKVQFCSPPVEVNYRDSLDRIYLSEPDIDFDFNAPQPVKRKRDCSHNSRKPVLYDNDNSEDDREIDDIIISS